MRGARAFLTAAGLALGLFGTVGGARAAPDADVRAAASQTQSGSLVRVSGNAEDMDVGVEVSLDGRKGEDSNFLYLKGEVDSQTAGESVALTDRLAPGLGVLDGAGLLGTFTPRYGHVRLGIGTEGRLRNSGFDVALTSQFMIGTRRAADPLNLGVSRVYPENRRGNLGLSFGYDGFNIGARYLYGKDALDSGYRGYDIGLGYNSGNWGTTLGFSGVSPSSASVSMDLLEARSLYTLRLGAFYQISPGLTLGGRLQYHDYRLFDSTDTRNRGEFFLNTNVNF